MKIHVKFCPFNFKNELREVKNHLKLLSYVNVTEDLCLNYCGQCLVQPFTVINGKHFASDSVDQLYYEVSKIFNLPPLQRN
nr:DUF1450 domain-containing protein [Anaerobacillus isosaccharinicus]QOY35178.1 DUF1450 domain-containing protein [Anaerobacillus isosaccharinicus]